MREVLGSFCCFDQADEVAVDRLVVAVIDLLERVLVRAGESRDEFGVCMLFVRTNGFYLEATR